MRRLGYRRDAAAAGLRRADRASASVGLIVDDVANPFFSAVHRGLEDVARARGVLIFAGSSDDSAAQERELVTSFSAHGVDGLVIVPAGDDHRYLERERDAGVPIVFLDRPPQRFVADTVLSDNAGGMRAAAEHLLAAGHTRIGYLGDRARVWTAAERLAACRGIVSSDLVRMNVTDSGAAADAVRELLDDPDPPTALLCGQNRITVGVLYALRELGLEDRVARRRLRRHPARGARQRHGRRPGPGGAGPSRGGAAVRPAGGRRRTAAPDRRAHPADRALGSSAR